MNKGFSLVEVIISVTILCILIGAVTNAFLSMVVSSQFGSNELNCLTQNRNAVSAMERRLKEARTSTLTLSGTSQSKTIEVSKTPVVTATVTVCSEVTFAVPVAFLLSSERVVWSEDSDAASYCPSSHELYGYVPCRIRYRRDSSTGNILKEYVRSGSVLYSALIGNCPQYSTLTDNGGSYLPGLSFYVYPNPPATPTSITILLTSRIGTVGGLLYGCRDNYSDQSHSYELINSFAIFSESWKLLGGSIVIFLFFLSGISTNVYKIFMAVSGCFCKLFLSNTKLC